MKGVIFNLLEEVVVGSHGDDAWEGLLDAADLDGAYTSLGNYEDEELLRLVSASAAELSLSEEAVLRWFGQQAIPRMAKRWPAFFEPHTETLPFLRSLNSVIHPEVRKLYAGAHCPYFDYNSGSEGALLLGYRSERKMCGLVHGFVLGVGDYYGQKLTIEHLECMHHGDKSCLVSVAAA